MTRREAVKRLVDLGVLDHLDSLAEVSRQLAMHCDSNPCEFVRENRCAWCGKKRDD